MTPLEYCQLMNGRAVLSGLWRGFFYDGDTRFVSGLEKMRKYERLRLIPNGACPIDLQAFSDRAEAGLAEKEGHLQKR